MTCSGMISSHFCLVTLLFGIEETESSSTQSNTHRLNSTLSRKRLSLVWALSPLTKSLNTHSYTLIQCLAKPSLPQWCSGLSCLWSKIHICRESCIPAWEYLHNTFTSLTTLWPWQIKVDLPNGTKLSWHAEVQSLLLWQQSQAQTASCYSTWNNTSVQTVYLVLVCFVQPLYTPALIILHNIFLFI